MSKIYELIKCVICKRETPRQLTNFLFEDNGNEIRVCYRCDHA